MYLHLGAGAMVLKKDIIGIFDLDNTSRSRITMDFLTRAEKSGRMINVSEDIPKSFVVCSDRVYLCQMSSGTLMKRIENEQSERLKI